MTEDINNTPSKFHVNWARAIIVSLIIVLAAVLLWFASDVNSLYRQGVVRPAISRAGRKMHTKPTISADQIQSWMTFRYIDYVFNLPSAYLPTNLNISDPKYLNSTLEEYAEKNNIKDTIFVQSVRDSVKVYKGGNP